MTIAFDQDRARRRVDGTAANDDLLALGAKQAEMRGSTSETAGWDAYDVWRRLIKEARERRAGTLFPQ